MSHIVPHCLTSLSHTAECLLNDCCDLLGEPCPRPTWRVSTRLPSVPPWPVPPKGVPGIRALQAPDLLEAPPALLVAPPALLEAPPALMEAPPALLGPPPALLRAPQALLGAPQAPLEAPQALLEAPPALLEAPPAPGPLGAPPAPDLLLPCSRLRALLAPGPSQALSCLPPCAPPTFGPRGAI